MAQVKNLKEAPYNHFAAVVMNTRFNPTANGRMHLGHAYMALVNENTAHKEPGAVFVLRIEDNQEHFEDRNGRANIDRWIDGIYEDMDWLGIPYDKAYCQSQKVDEIDYLRQAMRAPRDCTYQNRNPQFYPRTTSSSDTPYYSYTPRYTLEKVIMDYLDITTALIRGIDLISEFGLYCYYCQVMNYNIPEHIYLPRLATMENGKVISMSKVRGGCSIKDYRDKGLEAEELINFLRWSCLIDPYGTWLLDNIKAQPVLDERLMV